MSTVATPEQTLAPTWAWLRGPSFDLTFVVGTVVLAVASALLVVAEPRLFGLVLTLDLWLLGYHHVVATFTRLALDTGGLVEHRFLVTWLPLLVIAAVVALATSFGVWALATIYLYWQWWHYARQSYGIAQAYRRKSPGTPIEDGWLFQALFYLVPLWGILHRSAQDPNRFLGLPIRTLPIPPVVAEAVGWVAAASLLYWVTLKVVAAARGELPMLHTLYMASHYVVFTMGYVVIDDISYGWLVLNVWHNLQYLMFVWMFNNARFQGRADPKHRLLAELSQRENVVRYVVFCLALSTGVYGAILLGARASTLATVPFLAVAYQSINFHHYVVDAIIWKRKKTRATLAPSGA